MRYSPRCSYESRSTALSTNRMQTSAPLAVTGFDCELCSLSLGAVGASDPGARKDDVKIGRSSVTAWQLARGRCSTTAPGTKSRS